MVKKTRSAFNPMNWFGKSESSGVVLNESQVTQEEFNYLRWGKSGTENNSGFFDEEYLQKLKGLQGIELWDEMRRSDANVRMLLNVVKSPILRAKWFINAVDETEEEIHIKEFIEFVLFHDMASSCGLKRKTWMQFLEEALSCVDNGHALFEVQNKIVTDHPKYGSYVGLKDLAWRSPKTIEEWNLNSDGTIKNVRQVSQGDLDVDVEIPGKFLMPISINKEGDNYEGISALRFIYGNFFRKTLLRQLQGVGYERGVLGMPLGTIPKDKTDKTEEIGTFENMLSMFTSHEQSFMTRPEGWDIENFKIEFDAKSLMEAIEAENKEMSKSFLANFMELGMSSSGGGSYSLGSDLSDIFLSAIEVYAIKVTEAINNRVIRQIIDAKFGKRDFYPTLAFSGINDKAGEEQSKILKNLSDAGFIDPKENRMRAYIHTRFDLPPFIESKEDDIEEEETVDTTNLAEIFGPIFLNEEGREFVTLQFDKNIFTREGARAWATNHGFKALGVIDENEASHVVPQQDEMKIYDRIENQMLAPGVTVSIGVSARGLFSEVKLSETPSQTVRRVTKFIKTRSTETSEVMSRELKVVANRYVDDIEKFLNSNPKSKWDVGILNVEVRGLNAYEKALREPLVSVVADATDDAKREIPNQNVEFLELELGDVPRATVNKLNSEIKILVKTQEADLEKRVLFQFGVSNNRTDDIKEIVHDIREKALIIAEGVAVNTASKNAVSGLTNVARFEVFQTKEVLDQIESLIFMNQDPQAAICKNLQNRVFKKDDPAATQFLPPLHHNCESILVPQFIGVKGNRPLGDLGLQPSETNPDGTKTSLVKIMKSKSF